MYYQTKVLSILLPIICALSRGPSKISVYVYQSDLGILRFEAFSTAMESL